MNGPSPRPLRTLLTGATGFLGAHLLQGLLADGHTVTTIARSPARLGPLGDHPRLNVIPADLESAPFPGAQDVVVHAALVWPEDELELRDVVVTARLFDAAGRAGVSRCVLISSAGVHRPFTLGMREEDALETTDVYGATKAAGELFLRAACASHGMSGVVVRPGPIVGPPAFEGAAHRTDQRIARMVAAAREGRPIEAPGGGRQLSDVFAVARLVTRLTRMENPHPTWLSMETEPTSWATVAERIRAITGSDSPIQVAETAEPARFLTERVDTLFGPSSAAEALDQHIAHLARA